MPDRALNNKDETLFSNTLSFARSLCDNLTGVGVEQFVIRQDSAAEGWRSTAQVLSLHIPFFGSITGYYLISLDERTTLHLTTAGQAGSLNKEQLIDLLKETLNVATGRSIPGLEQSFGQLTYLPPVVVWGAIEFPPMLTASVTVESGVGRIQCVLGLDLAQLTIGRKLEEAQHKLNAVRISQKSMWIAPCELPDARFSVVYKSLNEAGGDLYDVFKVDDNLYGFFVGDVAGHDISTAFIASSMRALIKQNCCAGSDLIKSVQTINRVMYELLPATEYITGCYAVLDRGRGMLKVINMGHPPIVFVPRQGAPQRIIFEGDVLGAFENANYQVREFQVKAGDRFILYTDGLLDLYHTGGMIQSRTVAFHEALSEIVRSATLEELAETIFDKMHDRKKAMRDDVVVLGVEV